MVSVYEAHRTIVVRTLARVVSRKKDWSQKRLSVYENLFSKMLAYVAGAVAFEPGRGDVELAVEGRMVMGDPIRLDDEEGSQTEQPFQPSAQRNDDNLSNEK